MTTPNKLTPATLEEINQQLAAVRAKPEQVCNDLRTVAENDRIAFERELAQLHIATPETLTRLFKTHQLSSALVAKLPENAAWMGEQAAQAYVANDHSAMVAAARAALAQTFAPLPTVRKSLIEKAAELTTKAAAKLGFERAETIADRDAIEARQEHLASLAAAAETVIEYFANNSAAVNWPPVVSAIGTLKNELAAAAAAAK